MSVTGDVTCNGDADISPQERPWLEAMAADNEPQGLAAQAAALGLTKVTAFVPAGPSTKKRSANAERQARHRKRLEEDGKLLLHAYLPPADTAFIKSLIADALENCISAEEAVAEWADAAYAQETRIAASVLGLTGWRRWVAHLIGIEID